jgi:hypothetical protein
MLVSARQALSTILASCRAGRSAHSTQGAGVGDRHEKGRKRAEESTPSPTCSTAWRAEESTPSPTCSTAWRLGCSGHALLPPSLLQRRRDGALPCNALRCSAACSDPYLVLEEADENGSHCGHSVCMLCGDTPTYVGCGGHRHPLHTRLEEIYVREDGDKRAVAQEAAGMVVRELLQGLKSVCVCVCVCVSGARG